jgi:hypothetical protein
MGPVSQSGLGTSGSHDSGALKFGVTFVATAVSFLILAHPATVTTDLAIERLDPASHEAAEAIVDLERQLLGHGGRPTPSSC